MAVLGADIPEYDEDAVAELKEASNMGQPLRAVTALTRVVDSLLARIGALEDHLGEKTAEVVSKAKTTAAAKRKKAAGAAEDSDD